MISSGIRAKGCGWVQFEVVNCHKSGDGKTNFLVKKTHNGWLVLMILLMIDQSELAMLREQTTPSNASMGNQIRHNYKSGVASAMIAGKL